MPQPSENERLVHIHRLLQQHFNLEELRDLCFRLGVDYDDLGGEGRSARQRELVSRLNRAGRLDDLLRFCASLRPRVSWPELPAAIALDTEPLSPLPSVRNPRLIFLSYAHQDAVFAQRLAADLRAHRWQVWMAPDSIRSGEKWVTAINRGLAESSIFLLALTPHAVRSGWVRSETDAAIQLQHQEAMRLIPLAVLPTAMPPLWQTYQQIPFQNDYKAGLERLLQALQPDQMGQIAELYRQLRQAIGRSNWPAVQRLGAQITALYPDYRETEPLMAQAQREAAREPAPPLVVKRPPDKMPDAPLRKQPEQKSQPSPSKPKPVAPNSEPQVSRRKWYIVVGVIAFALLFSVWRLILNRPANTPQTGFFVPSVAVAQGVTVTRPADGMVLVGVPGGSFQMGSDPAQDPDAQNDEMPQHEVTLSPFWLDRTEVTNAMYETCVADGVCAASKYANNSSYNGASQPVVGVSWHSADGYCRWAGGQLPTEAQWEYAARGNDGRLYPWNNEAPNCSLTQFKGCSGETVSAGSFSPAGDSWVEAADMTGNVWEWVADWYDGEYYATLATSPVEDPVGPQSGTSKVLRGGSWTAVSLHMRAANRNADPPDNLGVNVGFRCVVPSGQ